MISDLDFASGTFKATSDYNRITGVRRSRAGRKVIYKYTVYAPGSVQSSEHPLQGSNSTQIPKSTMMAHTDESNGRTYVHSISSGQQSHLNITRGSFLIHEGTFKKTAMHRGEHYFRYQLTYTSNTGPEWALQPTRENRHEVWLPADGTGMFVYSADKSGRLR